MFAQYRASDPHIRVISEGSCDTEDWSNDVENHRNKLHFTVYSQNCNFASFYCISDQLNAALVSRRDSKIHFFINLCSKYAY